VIVLADSSPLITLARAQQFELLKEFYGKIVVSREVHDEVAIAGAGLPGATEIKGALGFGWNRCRPNCSRRSLRLASASVRARRASSALPPY